MAVIAVGLQLSHNLPAGCEQGSRLLEKTSRKTAKLAKALPGTCNWDMTAQKQGHSIDQLLLGAFDILLQRMAAD